MTTRLADVLMGAFGAIFLTYGLLVGALYLAIVLHHLRNREN